MSIAAGDSDNSRNLKRYKTSKTLTDSHIRQIEVLRILSERSTPSRRQVDIAEIALMCGLRDDKEVQRHLLILEGQKLVSPFPEGDFTSTKWQITTDGMRAVKTIEASVLQ